MCFIIYYSDINALASKTVRLKLAGVNSYGKNKITSKVIDSVNRVSNADDDMIRAIADNIAEKLQFITCSRSKEEGSEEFVIYASSFGHRYQ